MTESEEIVLKIVATVIGMFSVSSMIKFLKFRYNQIKEKQQLIRTQYREDLLNLTEKQEEKITELELAIAKAMNKITDLEKQKSMLEERLKK